MKRRRHSHRERLLIAGGILLSLLVAAVLVSGRIINRTAEEMSDRIIRQVGEYHYALLESEFGKAEEVFGIASRFAGTHPRVSETELRILTATLMELDSKVGRIWFSDAEGRTVRDFSRGGRACRCGALAADDYRRQAVRSLAADTLWSRVVAPDSLPVWSLARRVVCRDGSEHLCGIDLPLMDVHTYMTEQNPFSRSYAAVYDPEGVTLYHPDSLRIGRRLTGEAELAALRQVAASGMRATARPVSDWLGLEEERIYCPIRLGGRTCVAMVAVPRLAIEQEVEEFHFYTILIAVISVAVFAVLLVLAQRRWRREYELRRVSEKESARLHLQRVLDRIDPHFLFNSLNSLYALIRCNPDQAREFTLTLARVYRHVLERGREILVAVDDEIEFTRQYYSLQQIRFGNRIHLTTAIAPEAHGRLIPSMSLQTLVENAVKHNRITAQNPLCIRIYTREESLVIENNYTPREEHDRDSLGVGLESIRSVYRFYTDRNIDIRIEDGIFRCALPLLPCEK